MNNAIDHFHKEFRPILNKIQDGDVDMLDFLKFNLQKFSNIIESLGSET